MPFALFLLFLLPVVLFAQAAPAPGWRVTRLDMAVSSIGATPETPAFNVFLSGSKAQDIFDPEWKTTSISQNANLMYRVFDVRFWISTPGRSDAELLVGFANTELSGTLFDFIHPETGNRMDVKTKSQLFSLLSGVRYRKRAEKRFSWYYGGILHTAVGVGSKTDFVVDVWNDEGQSTNDYSFFAHETRLIQISAMLGFDYRIAGNAGISFQMQPGIARSTLDGSAFTGRSNWGRVGFFVRLK